MKNDESLNDVCMIFKREDGTHVLWAPALCVTDGTPVDGETGEDLEYVGLCRDNGGGS
jgi:hypothetical protein